MEGRVSDDKFISILLLGTQIHKLCQNGWYNHASCNEIGLTRLAYTVTP